MGKRLDGTLGPFSIIAKKTLLVGEDFYTVNKAETGWGRGPVGFNPDWPHESV